MKIVKSYNVTYLKDNKQVSAWLAPDVDPDTIENLISKSLVIVLQADEDKILVKDGIKLEPSVFLTNESEAENYTEVDDPHIEPDIP